MWIVLLACVRPAPDSDSDVPRLPGEQPPHASSVPFDLVRTDDGTAPISAEERAAATDDLVALLVGTRYFETVANRAHGAPAGAAPAYATWGSGTQVSRTGGVVTFVEGSDGADNNGLRTAPLLEAACWAYALAGNPAHAELTARLAEGFSSWSRAMERGPDDAIGLLARAAYPAPYDVPVGDVTLHVDTQPARPGQDGPPAQFIHLPDNPWWPDLYVRNTHSKDDLGHTLRALGAVDACVDVLPGRASLVTARAYGEQWAGRIVADDYRVATLDPSLQEQIPDEQLAVLIDDLECGAQQAVHLQGTGEPDPGLDCGDGDTVTEGLIVNSSAMQVVRSFHLGLVEQALVWGQDDLAETYAGGLAARLDTVMALRAAGDPPDNFHDGDLAAFMLNASAAGVPLRPSEVRFLYAQLAASRIATTDAAALGQYALFDADAPDGVYAFEPGGGALGWVDLGLFLAPCAAKYRAPGEVFDCDRVAAALAP